MYSDNRVRKTVDSFKTDLIRGPDWRPGRAHHTWLRYPDAWEGCKPIRAYMYAARVSIERPILVDVCTRVAEQAAAICDMRHGRGQ